MTSHAVFVWLRSQPVLLTLLLLTAIDILSGLGAALVTKKLSSDVSYRGMVKKTMLWLIVGLAASVDPLSPDIPETKMTCLFFCVMEGLSILENAGRAGVPIPKILRDALVKIGNEATGQMAVVPAASAVVTTTTTATAVVGSGETEVKQ